MGSVLSEQRLKEAMADLTGWSGDTSEISRTVTASSFPAGIALVSAVAEVAEQMDHHPDIDIRWRDVTFRLATHTAGGVTEQDLTLAARIDDLARTAQ